MRIHLIAIGGKVMHNLALELLALGHKVTGSDDEIYDPAYSRLKEAGLLPKRMGWNAQSISSDIDKIILGMHAQADNPELLKAQELGVKIVSFPEYIGEAIADKNKIVVCGSHGKSTITAMIMHVLKHESIISDYALGGMLDGFDRMVSITDAPVAVIEGDEYLSSRIDLASKMMHYHGDTIIITGIEWDHMNVFPTLEIYIEQFKMLVKQAKEEGAKVIWFQSDPILKEILDQEVGLESYPYKSLKINDLQLVEWQGEKYKFKIFGDHNLANMNAARIACESIGVKPHNFFKSMESFQGVGKRLQRISDNPIVYLDYAHAPSKVRATMSAVKEHHKGSRILALYELHTYSSLSAAFLPNYKDTLSKADSAAIYFDKHALEIKRLPNLDPVDVKNAFGQGTEIFSDKNLLTEFLQMEYSEFDVI
ncbi:MAG: UDP-N-acetylmuramate: L-alanyl-gamma-D-glutamyl-meso-diaminopimelate ligase, partial [Saprospiraceae bacterium]